MPQQPLTTVKGLFEQWLHLSPDLVQHLLVSPAHTDVAPLLLSYQHPLVPDVITQVCRTLLQDQSAHVKQLVTIFQDRRLPSSLFETLAPYIQTQEQQQGVHTLSLLGEAMVQHQILAAALANPQCPSQWLSTYADSQYSAYVLANPQCPSAILAMFYAKQLQRAKVLKHPNCPLEILTKFLPKTKQELNPARHAVALMHPRCWPLLVNDFALDPTQPLADPHLLAIMVKNPCCPELWFDQAITNDTQIEPNLTAFSPLINNPNCPPKLLFSFAKMLCESPHLSRSWLLHNSRLGDLVLHPQANLKLILYATHAAPGLVHNLVYCPYPRLSVPLLLWLLNQADAITYRVRDID